MSPPRVVLSKLGLDGHDVGIQLVARGLRDAGFEVIYLGKRVSTPEIVRAVIDEDADAVGLSCLSGGLSHFAIELAEQLREQSIDVPILVGGIDEPQELARLTEHGIDDYFGPGASVAEAVRAFQNAVA